MSVLYAVFFPVCVCSVLCLRAFVLAPVFRVCVCLIIDLSSVVALSPVYPFTALPYCTRCTRAPTALPSLTCFLPPRHPRYLGGFVRSPSRPGLGHGRSRAATVRNVSSQPQLKTPVRTRFADGSGRDSYIGASVHSPGAAPLHHRFSQTLREAWSPAASPIRSPGRSTPSMSWSPASTPRSKAPGFVARLSSPTSTFSRRRAFEQLQARPIAVSKDVTAIRLSGQRPQSARSGRSGRSGRSSTVAPENILQDAMRQRATLLATKPRPARRRIGSAVATPLASPMPSKAMARAMAARRAANRRPASAGARPSRGTLSARR